MEQTRRGKRRERKNSKRQIKQIKMEEIATLQNLYVAAKEAIKLLTWKQSVQRFLISILFRIFKAKNDLINGVDVRQGFICFNISERGKPREIQSLHFFERFIQKFVFKFALERFLKTLIKENSASQKGKGTLFAQQTFEKHLREFLRKYGGGYILLIDFSKYFENIRHEPLIEFYNKHFHDEKLRTLLIKAVTAYEKGLGLGSELSQFNAIIYANKIDHFVKNRFKYYGRYMDDSYIICENKEKLKEFSEILFTKYEELGIVVNKRKTKIISLKQTITFLKTRYKVVENNKIIKKPCSSSITRARRRFRKMIKFVEKGEMKPSELRQSFDSWSGSMKRRHARRSVYKIKKEIQKCFTNLTNKQGNT